MPVDEMKQKHDQELLESKTGMILGLNLVLGLSLVPSPHFVPSHFFPKPTPFSTSFSIAIPFAIPSQFHLNPIAIPSQFHLNPISITSRSHPNPSQRISILSTIYLTSPGVKEARRRLQEMTAEQRRARELERMKLEHEHNPHLNIHSKEYLIGLDEKEFGMYSCLYGRMCVCLHVCMPACLYVCMSVCLYVFTSVCQSQSQSQSPSQCQLPNMNPNTHLNR